MATDDKKHEKILADAKAFRDEAESYWQDTYERGREDKEFATIKGAQWDSEAVEKRKAEGKPTLEFNLVRKFARQQENTMRQNRPQIQVVPVDSGADVEVAKVLAGLIKDTEESSNAEDAYDQAGSSAVYSGLGFFRITTDYMDERSFNQEPKFLPIENPEAVLMDPLSRRLDGSDQSRCLIGEWVEKAAIEREYGKDAVSDFEMKGAEKWHDTKENTVFIAEFFYKEEVKDTLVMLEDGTVDFKSVLLEQWSEDDLKLITQHERDTTRTKIKWAKLSGCKVLETGVFPGKYIPVIPVYGEVTWIGEKRHVFSLIHFATDPQRLLNYWKSTEAHILQKNQDDITAVDAESIVGYEDEWQNPGKYAVSRYKTTNEQGQPVTPPQRIGAAAPPVGILNAAESAAMAIPDILNMHAPQMGQDVNQQSGRAIGLLQRQADTAHFHFQDNLNKSLRQAGRILVDLYPVLYDTPMVRRVVGVDGSEELVPINAPPRNPSEVDKAIDGVLNNLSIGRYDVRIDTGPNFNTQREQAFQLMMQMMQYSPELMGLAGDLILKDSPLPYNKDIAERFKKQMNPQLLEDDKDMPPQAKAMIQQLDQAIQQMQQELQAAQAELADKNADRELKAQQMITEFEKAIQVAQINASSRTDVEEIRNIYKMIEQQVSLLHAPPQWSQKGESVDNYRPEQPQQFSQTDGFEPPPGLTQSDLQDPATEQGFLMPEESAQPQIAPDPDQIGDSALITDGMQMLNLEQPQNDV